MRARVIGYAGGAPVILHGDDHDRLRAIEHVLFDHCTHPVCREAPEIIAARKAREATP